MKAKDMLILTNMLSKIITEVDDLKAVLKESVSKRFDENYEGDDEEGDAASEASSAPVAPQIPDQATIAELRKELEELRAAVSSPIPRRLRT